MNYTTNTLYEYTAVGGTTHVWDANGNLTDNGTYKYKYNYKNLICEVRLKSDNSLVATYRYDAKGDRVEKDVAGGVFERYVLSKAEQTSNGIACWHVVAVYGASDSWKQTFVFADEIDAVVMLEQKDVLDFDSDGNTTELTRSFYHANALGSVMAISDMNQAVAVSYRYDPYGKVTITRNGQPQTSDPLGQHWGFTGRFLDEESGLNYYRARYYDAGLGRFLQRDPVGHADGACLYEYSRSRPACLHDPSGRLVGLWVFLKAADRKLRIRNEIEFLENWRGMAHALIREAKHKLWERNAPGAEMPKDLSRYDQPFAFPLTSDSQLIEALELTLTAGLSAFVDRMADLPDLDAPPTSLDELIRRLRPDWVNFHDELAALRKKHDDFNEHLRSIVAFQDRLAKSISVRIAQLREEFGKLCSILEKSGCNWGEYARKRKGTHRQTPSGR